MIKLIAKFICKRKGHALMLSENWVSCTRCKEIITLRRNHVLELAEKEALLGNELARYWLERKKYLLKNK